MQSNLLYDWMIFEKKYDEREIPTAYCGFRGVFWILYETIVDHKFGNKKY